MLLLLLPAAKAVEAAIIPQVATTVITVIAFLVIMIALLGSDSRSSGFLLAKATYEIHDKLESEAGYRSAAVSATFGAVLIQIVLLDIVFSLDSVLTAVGMVDQIGVMVAAVVIAVLIMLVAAGPISKFVNERPTLKILALSFLLLVGFSLVAEGLDVEIPKGYIYFAMFFSLLVEMINLRIRRPAAKPIQLRQRYVEGNGGDGSAAPARS